VPTTTLLALDEYHRTNCHSDADFVNGGVNLAK
jgi:hypothetical protein